MTRSLRTDSGQPATIRLVIVTRHQLDGDALAALFHAQPDFRVLCTTTDIKVASAVGRHRSPDVVLLDAGLLASGGLQGVASIVEQLGATPILLLDDEINQARLAAALTVPHVGYFTRSAPFSELAQGVHSLVKGERVFDSLVQSRIHQTSQGWQFRHDQHRSPLANLTPRELEVLRLIALGNTVKECAEILELSPSTVDNHKSRLMKKLGVHKSLDLTRLAIREGLVRV